MRKAAAVLLALLLAVPPGSVLCGPQTGTIQGSVTMGGRPLEGVTVAFIDLESGKVVRATSSSQGGFQAVAAPGEYAVTTESRAGLAIGKAPVRVAVVSGKAVSADVELVAVAGAVLQESAPPAQAPATQPPPAEQPATSQPQSPFAPTTGAGAAIQFEPVTCFVVGEFPLLDAGIEPITSVARARVYFKAAQTDTYYYVEMSQDQGRFFGKLPRPKLEASPLSYYLQATTTEFEESQTSEIQAIVVKDKDECKDRKIAAFGPPGEVTVFSAASGTSMAPVGFAAGGAAIAAGTLALILGGAAAAGVVGGVVIPPNTTVPPPITLPPITIPIPITLPPITTLPITTFR